MALVDYVRNDATPDTVATMINEASRFGTCGITMTQIRSIFGAVRRLDALKDRDALNEQSLNREIAVELRILEARIHYRIARFLESPPRRLEDQDRRSIETLRNELKQAIAEVGNSRAKFKRFVEAFESLVAFMPRK